MDLKEVIVVSSDVVTLGNLLHSVDGAEKSGAVAVAGERDGNISSERVPYGGGVNESSVTADDAALFEFADAIGSGRRGEAEELAEFGPGSAPAAHQDF